MAPTAGLCPGTTIAVAVLPSIRILFLMLTLLLAVLCSPSIFAATLLAAPQSDLRSLLKDLASHRDAVRQPAIAALAHMGDEGVEPLVRELRGERRAERRAEIIASLLEAGVKREEVVLELIEALPDRPLPGGARYAATSARTLGCWALHVPEEWSRKAVGWHRERHDFYCLRALADHGTAALPALEKVLGKAEEGPGLRLSPVELTWALAIERAGPEDGLPAIRRALQSEHRALRAAGLVAAALLGPLAAPLASEVEAATTDADPAMAWRAWDALASSGETAFGVLARAPFMGTEVGPAWRVPYGLEETPWPEWGCDGREPSGAVRGANEQVSLHRALADLRCYPADEAARAVVFGFAESKDVDLRIRALLAARTIPWDEIPSELLDAALSALKSRNADLRLAGTLALEFAPKEVFTEMKERIRDDEDPRIKSVSLWMLF